MLRGSLRGLIHLSETITRKSWMKQLMMWTTGDKPVKLPLARVLPSFRFESLTRDSDVRFYTGFIITNIFKTIFEHLLQKATNMNYWDGPRKTYFSPELDGMLSAYLRMRWGPSRKLTLEQEFFLVLIKLRVGLLQYDLAHRIGISPSKVSQIFITWIKLLSKELSVLIVWPSQGQVRRTIPECFRRLYPKVHVIIDCTEVFTETSLSLEVQCLLYSDYKHHTTAKILIGITPNGSVSYVSTEYGGRTSDVHIVWNSNFMQFLEPHDEITVASRSKQILSWYNAAYAFPPVRQQGYKCDNQTWTKPLQSRM